jgi:broad specificity phosphatase PhoE
VAIGLLRHFPVEHGLPRGWRTAAELEEWRRRYDASPVLPHKVELGAIRWDFCLSSDLDRAMATARAVFDRAIESTPLLREAEFARFPTGSLRLPVLAWKWMLRLAWLSGHGSQRRHRDHLRSRITGAADAIASRADNVLAVSHAGFLYYLSVELRRRGFAGPKLRLPECATLYVYERGAI